MPETCEHPRPYKPMDERYPEPFRQLVWRCDECHRDMTLEWSRDGDSTWWETWEVPV